MLAELMEARQKTGEIRNDFSPVELARHFQQALFGTTVVWSLNASRPLAHCLKDMTVILWSGMRSGSSPILSQDSSEAEGEC